MSSVDGVSAEGIGDHKSGHLGRAQAKADQNGRSAGRTPRARDENAGNFALSKVFFARIRPVRGRGDSNVWVLVAITIIDVVATNISIKAT